MFTRKKLWLGLGAALATSSAFSSDPASAQDKPMPAHNMMSMYAGEAGEGAIAKDIATSDSAYRAQLALMRGHLWVGLNLYRAGEQQAAATHMKHPADELYAGLVKGLEPRQAAGFGDVLTNLANTVQQHGSVAEADAAYEAVLAAISRAEMAAGKPQAKVLGEVIQNLVGVAAAEYDIAVEDGALVNAHEYQDSLGFVHIAGVLTDQLAEITGKQEIIDEIRTQLEIIAPTWPSLVPPEKLDTDPAKLYGAAARIELAAFAL